MHLPNYPVQRPNFAVRFWPTTSDGACFSTSGRPLMYRETASKGAEIMWPTTFVNSNTNHIRFASKRKCLQWLQKINRPNMHIESETLFIHTK